jgi:TonB family protein
LCWLAGQDFVFVGDLGPENMRTPICEIVLILLLIHAPTHHGFAADQTQQVGGVKALAIYAPRPQYPYEARVRRQTGTGEVVLVVDPSTGVVKNAEMATSTGNEILDNAALNAFRLWRFKPGTVANVRIPIGFAMGGFVIVGNALKVTKNLDMDTVLAPYLGKGTVLHGPNPAYPRNAPWTDKEGKGTYELHVGKDGKVGDVKVLKSSGDTTFDGVAVSTLRTWRLRKGPLVVELPLAFKLTPHRYDVWIP